MLSAPTLVYLAIGGTHLTQQLCDKHRRDALSGLDYIVQALVMAVIVELLCRTHLSVVAWAFTTPALALSFLGLFYFLMFQCSI